jgi:hypothetical protein
MRQVGLKGTATILQPRSDCAAGSPAKRHHHAPTMPRSDVIVNLRGARSFRAG